MKIETRLIENTWVHKDCPHGYANGYIGIPEGHPWFGMSYEEIHEKFDVHVHGGLTWSQKNLPNAEPDGLWWIGFDTMHYGDNHWNRDFLFCQHEVEYLKEQALNPKESEESKMENTSEFVERCEQQHN